MEHFFAQKESSKLEVRTTEGGETNRPQGSSVFVIVVINLCDTNARRFKKMLSPQQH